MIHYMNEQEPLQERLRFLSLFAERTINGMIITDAQGRVEWVNAAFMRTCGYTLEEMAGRTPGSVLQGPESDPETKARIHAALRNRETVTEEIINYHKNGTPFWIKVEITPIFDEAGEVARFVAIETDITQRKRAQEALLRSEAFLSEAQQLAHIGNWNFDIGSQQLTWSQEVYRIYGYDPYQAPPTYQEWLQRTPVEERQKKSDALEAAMHHGTGYEFDHRIVLEDGTEKTVHAIGKAVRNAAGEIERLVGTVIDITERKQVEDALRVSEERYALALTGSRDGVWDWDIRTGNAYFSDRWKSMIGYAPDELANNISSWTEHLHPDDEKRAMQTLQDYFAHKISEYEVEFRFRHKDGSYRWILARGVALFDAEERPYRMAGSHTDITERKRVELELQQARETLERRVAERTTELTAANVTLQTEIVERKRVEEDLRRAKEAAEAANLAKSQFLANMSHELRTPMNAILGFSEILADQTFGELNARQARYVNNVLTSGRHLLQLINDVLDLAKVEAGKLELAPVSFDVLSALDDVKNIVRTLATKKQILVTVQTEAELLPLTADQGKFKQILYNLLSNAIKFTPERGKVTVGVEPIAFEPREPGVPGLRFCVRDTGIGIPSSDLQRIFGEFEQVDSSYARKQQGTGLGLALTRRLVELHGGRIWAESEGEGKGSAFFFTLPLQPPAPQEVNALDDSETEVPASRENTQQRAA